MDADVLATIEKWIMQEGRTFNGKMLAIERGIPQHKAILHMQHFLNEHKGDRPYVLWSLSGRCSSEQEVQSQSQASSSSMDFEDERRQDSVSRYAVKLVDDSNVEQVKKSFAGKPTVRLYALAPPLPSKPTSAHRIAATSQLAIVQHELKNTVKYVKAWQEADRGVAFGALRPPADIKSLDEEQAGKKGLVDSASEVKTRIATTLQTKVTPNKTNAKRIDETKRENAKKVVKDEDEEMLDDGPIGYADRNESVATVKVEEGGATSKRADAGDKKSTQEEKRRRQKQELMDMMDEDRDGKADPEVPAAKSTSTSIMGGGANRSGKQSKKVSEMASDEKDDVSAQPIADAEPKEKRRVRKQRKVMRKEVTKNAKGYRITKDVEGYESYSSFESSEDEQPTKPKKADAASKNSAKTTDEQTEREAQEETTTKDRSGTSTPVPKEDKAASATAAQKKSGTGGGGSGQQKLSSFFKKK